MTWDDVRRLALALPGVEEATSYGAPAFRVGGRVFLCQPARPALRDDGRVVVLFDVEPEERALLVEAEPKTFFFTDHYAGYPAVLARLPALQLDRLQPYVERSWRVRAPRRLLKDL